MSNRVFQAIIETSRDLSQKRKVETEESPRKRSRTDFDVHQKRNKKDREESPSKPTRRENTRIKDFPAGNITTSGSRIAFLKTLCKMPKFLSMVDLVPAVVGLFFFETFLNI